MPRPKKLTNAARLNLLVNGKAKRKAQKLAFDLRISVGQLFEKLVEKAAAK